MKKRLIVGAVAVIVLIGVIVTVLGSVVLWPGMYGNSGHLTAQENAEIKELVLNAVKEQCSSLYDIDKSAVYAVDPDLEGTQKSWFCVIDPSFMNTVKKIDSDSLRLEVTIYHPEFYYFYIDIGKIGDRYLITRLQIDI